MRRRRGSKSLLAALAVFVVPAAACSEDSNPFQVITDVEFASSLGIDLADFTELASGVYIREDSVGTGAVIAVGDTVAVNYITWLADGLMIDSGSIPIPGILPVFVYGVTSLIDGFTLGMAGMAEDGTRTIIIPPNLGYGANPPPGSPIPVGAILIFEIELTDVQ
jgi:FKBP-type peptidyl-prolyl cis-trans isomerase FkpA